MLTAENISPPKVKLGRAVRGFIRLRRNKEDTRQVFEIVNALAGGSSFRAYDRMLQSVEGGRQAYDRAELAPYFDDPDWLARFPAGTVGAAYREFRERRSLTADGLAQEAHKASDRVDDMHPVAWYARRVRDVHDVWHTLAGYGTDALGESCVLGFTFAQTRNPGIAAIAFGSAFEFSHRNPGPPYLRAVIEGWRLGRAASPLICEDYLALMAEPLASARKRLGLRTPRIYLSVPFDARETRIAQPRRLWNAN